MNSQQEKHFQAFESLLSRWTGAYQCAVISFVGIKTPQGPSLLSGRVMLEPTRSGVSDTPFRFETEHLIAAQFVSGASTTDINSFLAKARNGQIVANDGTYLPLHTDRELSTYFSPFYHPSVSEGPRLPSLRVSGTSRYELITIVADPLELDWELKAAETPFDDLNELMSYCNLPSQMQMGGMTLLEILAKAPVAIAGTSTIREENAIIECRLAAALDVSKLRLGYKILHKDYLKRESVSGSAFDWRQEEDINVGTYRMSVGEAPLLQAFVSYTDVSLHQWWVTDPEKRLNPRYAVHQIFDDGMETLRRMLFKPESNKSQMFESAVSTLLSLLGFSVSNYGRVPKLQDGPDIIAVSPSGHVCVIECTIGLLNNKDKLSKLVQRSMLIREKLNHAGYNFLQLQPVIVTQLSRGEATADLEMAGKHEIAVVCKGELKEMLEHVNLPPNADRLFQDAKNLIPDFGQSSMFEDKS